MDVSSARQFAAHDRAILDLDGRISHLERTTSAGQRIEAGSLTGSLNGGVAVTFAAPFPTAPVVVVTGVGNAGTAYVQSVTATGFTLLSTTTGTSTANWLAVGHI